MADFLFHLSLIGLGLLALFLSYFLGRKDEQIAQRKRERK